jgi:hypothetical protein
LHSGLFQIPSHDNAKDKQVEQQAPEEALRLSQQTRKTNAKAISRYLENTKNQKKNKIR